MNRWLGLTGQMEITCAFLFLFAAILWSWQQQRVGVALGPLSWIALFGLDIILVQGGLYWLCKQRGTFDRWPARQRFRLIQNLQWVNLTILLVFPVCLGTFLAATHQVRRTDVFVGIALNLFAWGEFSQYFWYKINMRPREWRQMCQSRQLIPARLRRELRKAQRELA